MLRFRQPINNQPLAYAYKFIYSIAAFAFTLATISTLPLLQQDLLLTAYHFLLRVSAICMVAAEIIELGVDPVPKWSVVLCFISGLGNVLYICSTIIYQDFNKGELYIIAMFCTSLSIQLKILCIIVQDSRTNQYLFQYQKSRLIKISSILIGTMLFLVSTIIQQLQVLQQTDLMVGMINVLGGSMFVVSACMVLKKDDHVGYAIFDNSVEIPTIL